MPRPVDPPTARHPAQIRSAGFLSKDTVHRRLRQLRRAGLIEVLPGRPDRTDAPAYALHLDGTGLSVTSHARHG